MVNIFKKIFLSEKQDKFLPPSELISGLKNQIDELTAKDLKDLSGLLAQRSVDDSKIEKQEQFLPRSIKKKLRQEISKASGKKITFAKFMDISLYDTEDGYYSSGKVKIEVGAGHYFTAAEIHPAFGATMANVMYLMWQKLGRPETFYIVEGGAGNGTMAFNALNKIKGYYPEFYKSVKYIIIEISQALIERQRVKLASMPVNWIHGSATQIPLKDVEGVFISNELPDAFPVHRLIRRKGAVKEIYVALDAMGDFVEVEGDVSVEVNDPLYTSLVAKGEDSQITACTALLQWQASISSSLKRGYVLTADYFADSGGPGSYIPATFFADPRTSRASEDHSIYCAYLWPGMVDITTNVNDRLFFAAAKKAGFEIVENQWQNDFLKKYGLEDEIKRINFESGAKADDKGAEYLLKTGSPRFAVVLQSKNIEKPELKKDVIERGKQVS